MQIHFAERVHPGTGGGDVCRQCEREPNDDVLDNEGRNADKHPAMLAHRG